MKSLVDLCIARIIPYLALSNNIDMAAQEVLELPHIKTSIWKYCVENARTLADAPSHASVLLVLALKGEKYINLAHFHDLLPVAVRDVLRSCPEARSINLSGTAAMADREIEETLAAVDHDLDALYLLSPPLVLSATLPKAIMRALRNWNHVCSKVLISSVLAQGPTGPIPKELFRKDTNILRSLDCNPTHYLGCKSFPITQIVYLSTFNNLQEPRSRPIMAHVFLGGGFVSPFRLWTSILKTIGDMHENSEKETLQFTRFLTHNLALGPPTADSPNSYEVRSIPTEASFATYNQWPEESLYNDPGCDMCDLTPDAWTVVVLRDVIPRDPARQEPLTEFIDTDQFRALLLQPKRVIPAGDWQSILDVSSQVKVSSLSPNLDPPKELTSSQRRTVIQFQVGPQDIDDAISAVQSFLSAAATVRDCWEKSFRSQLAAYTVSHA
jgi:hypothetical protein